MAAGAQSQLKKVVRYKSWDEFYRKEGEGIRIAFTRRAGRRRRVIEYKDVLRKIKSSRALSGGSDVYLIFGPEADGLDIDDLALVNFCCSLPVFGEFGSMNISHAVLLALYIWRDHFPPSKRTEQIKGTQAEPVRAVYFPDKSIRDWLTAMGFDIEARRSSAYLTLKKLFLQNLPTQHELHVLESILNQNIRKLRTRTSAFSSSEDLTDDLAKVSRK